MRKFHTLIILALILAGNWSCMPADRAMVEQTTALPTAVDKKNKITEFILDNGMKVVVKEDHRAPLVISQLWYKVGSSDEHSGITGVSHALEHMMFKGTSRYSSEDFTLMLRRIGARNNAFTGSDFTGYYQKMEKSHWPLSLELESDRMVNLQLREEDFLKEIEVVKEERRLRTDDKPAAKAYEQLYATAFSNSPYGHPVIGWMNDLENMNLDDLKLWYRRWYMPNNAILVVAGDVQPDEVYELANRHMGPIPARPLQASKPRQEMKQEGERRVVMRLAAAKKPSLLMGYKVPAVKRKNDAGMRGEEWEPYALGMLSRLLASGSNSRFQKNIVRGQQIAVSAGAHYNMYSRHNGLFVVSGAPNLDHSLEQLEEALEKELEKIKTELADEESLQIVKSRAIAGEVFAQDSIMHQAYKIGSMEARGFSWQEAYKYLDRLQQVTAEQVQEVARRYLSKETRTVVYLQPAAENEKMASGQL